MTGKMKRSAILEKHAACIASMFVHKSKHTYNSMCEASNAAIQDVKNHAPHQLLTQVRNPLHDLTMLSIFYVIDDFGDLDNFVCIRRFRTLC